MNTDILGRTLLLLTCLLLPAAALSAETTTLTQLQEAAGPAGVVLELPQWETDPAQIEAAAEAAMAEGNRRLDAIAALEPGEATFRNTVAALDDAWLPVVTVLGRVDMIDATSPDEKLRDAAHEASRALEAWLTDASFREDVYRVVKAFADTGPTLEGEDAMLLETVLRDYRRNGMDLPQEKRDELQRLKNRLNELNLAFQKAVKEADVEVIFTREELDGVSDDFLDNPAIRGKDGRYRVNANVTWQVLEVLRNARSEETRRRLVLARMNRAREENVPRFTEMLRTRARIATLLGYDHWADYRPEPKMAKTGRTARRFLVDLKNGLEPKFRSELETLRLLKVAETGDRDAQLHYWDVGYYKNQLKKQRYHIDSEKLKVYFELERTLDGMFRIFEELFGLRITPVSGKWYRWVEELRLYAVADAASGAPLGLIYMDMFPRKGKYNHFAQFGITPGKRLADGRYQRPVVALVCNFPPPAGDKPSLLTFDHVETLFHEFGHALHSVLTEANYLEFSGTSVPRDFVEAPSQMLENWVRDKKVLDRFAVDYRDGTRRIPAELLDQMEAARLATIATHYRGQIGYGLLDLALHMTTDDRVFETFVEVSNRILSDTYLPVPENTAFVASFGHLAGGYDAGYYGYAWADAIAADLASVFRKAPGRFMDREAGMRLRREIYAVGGSREIEDSIRAFLGRPRSLRPFFQQLGLQSTKGLGTRAAAAEGAGAGAGRTAAGR